MKKTTLSYHQVEMIETLTLVELCRFCHVGQDWIVKLVEHGVLEPYGPDAADWRFDPVNVARARKSQHLVRDFGLNAAGLALVLELMDERDELARKLAQVIDG
tara:strand:- start:981 stop:1289 length:309 start_codon:yes stop_codon:yes gene_type:complete